MATMVPALPDEYSGRLDDATLAAVDSCGVMLSIECANWAAEFPDQRKATATMSHDDTHIYILFRTTGPDLCATVDVDQGPVSSDSCFEFFVSPDPTSLRYWNFEFNAIGRINASNREKRSEPTRLDAAQLATIATRSSVGDKPFGKMSGEHTWWLAVAIPLALLGVTIQDTDVTMSANLYKCGSATPSPHYLSWAPINTDRPDFHRPDFFAPLTLAVSRR